MTLLQTPQQKVESILKDIEKFREEDGISLIQILDKQPSMIPEVIGSLASIMSKDDSKSFISACRVLNMIAQEYPDKVSDSMEMIMERLSCRKKDLNEYEWIPALELFTKINEGHPECMRTAVPSLLVALRNPNKTIREISFFLLAHNAAKNPDFFKYSSNELIKILNGLNIDGRLFACKIIGIIAAINPVIVEKTYEVIEDFSLNHPDTNLRSEAGFVLNMLKPKTYAAKQPEVKVPLVKQNEIGETYKSRVENALSMLISGKTIESATLVGTGDRIIARSGTQIDNSLLSKITSILSFDSDQSGRRISIEQAGKKIVAVGVANKAILVVTAGPDTSMDILLIILDKSVERLNEILVDEGFTETS